MNACKHGQLARSCNVCELEQERCDLQDLVARQAALLTAAANALRGPPPELTLWSHHDVPQLIDALRAERDALKRERDQLHIEIVSGDRTMTAVPTRLVEALCTADDRGPAAHDLVDWFDSHRPEQKEKQG
jgi:hypothetical protein